MPPRTMPALSPLRRAVAAAGVAALAVLSTACSGPDVNREYTDIEALAEFESRIAASVEQVEDFPGFGTRFREMSGCFYGEDHDDQDEDESRSNVSVRYTLAYEFADDPVVQDMAAVFERHWTDLGWEVDVIRDDDSGEYLVVRATSEDGISMLYQAADIVSLDANHSGCVAIDDEPLAPSEPIGGVSEIEDRFENFSNRSNPDDEI